MGQLFPNSVYQTFATPSAPSGTRNLYGTTPAPDGVVTGFSIVGGTPAGTYFDLYLNGVLLATPTHYVYTASATPHIVLTTAPQTNDVLEAIF